MTNDTFKITKQGFYRQHNGGKAEVLYIGAESCFVKNSNGDESAYYLNGRAAYRVREYDIVSEWREPISVVVPTIYIHRTSTGEIFVSACETCHGAEIIDTIKSYEKLVP